MDDRYVKKKCFFFTRVGRFERVRIAVVDVLARFTCRQSIRSPSAAADEVAAEACGEQRCDALGNVVEVESGCGLTIVEPLFSRESHRVGGYLCVLFLRFGGSQISTALSPKAFSEKCV